MILKKKFSVQSKSIKYHQTAGEQQYAEQKIVGHSLKLHWFADLMNVTEEVTIHRPNVSTLLSSAFIRGDLNAATRGPFIRSLISGLFFDEV